MLLIQTMRGIHAKNHKHIQSQAEKSQQKHAKAPQILPKPGWEELSIVVHAEKWEDTHSCLKTRLERTYRRFPRNGKGKALAFNMLSDLWICAVEQSHSGNLRAGRSQGTCFWSQPQGPRQGISLTCRIISSLVGTHIISHLGDFLAFMLHLHSIRESKSSSTISSAQIWTQDSLHVSKFTLTSQRNNFQRSQIN